MELLAVIVVFALFSQEVPFTSAAIRAPSHKQSLTKRKVDPRETTKTYWNNLAQNFIKEATTRQLKQNVAKNVIFFMGDGMSVPTVTAARILEGGEAHQLSFEKFPYTALSKTYCLNRQVSESTSTGTAYLCGVKANWYTSGLSGAVKENDCEGSLLPENHAPSIAAWSQLKDKWTGFVTTARVTHASPQAVFSHNCQKRWESDADMAKSNVSSENCQDVGKQLIYGEVGKNLHVIMGCGRKKLRPKNSTDEEGKPGERRDGLDLIKEWQIMKKEEKKSYEYMWNRKQLLNLLQTRYTPDYLLGLFDDSLCPYNEFRDRDMDPSLEEMTEAAIKTLSKSSEGYFLFVEGGMIDQAHHKNKAALALDETLEFAKAIQRAVTMTNEEETLIVVTADHAHTMSIGGYPRRGANILGTVDMSDTYNFSAIFPTLSYANGDGYRPLDHNYAADKIDASYVYPNTFKIPLETHGGDDVAVYARGPWAHLFTGVMEQNVIPHLMAYASCVGNGRTACAEGAVRKSKAFRESSNSIIVLFTVQIVLFVNLLTVLW